ncbi:DNA cytosine methyltransferase [Enterococcus faecalis]|uniref:DNA cytosine methyltransferase n=1 Tax=Enterococcus faecalis TaxID=1351 RepID=UPI0020742624|nr:DNA cytosine methyltransferase [Enterococcus faecalis]
MKISTVDLFCGVGGLTRGLLDSGIDVVAGIDVEEKCKYPYENNNGAKFIHADIKKIDSDEVMSLYPKNTDIKMLAGCAPCQPFSSYSYRYKGIKSSENKLDLLSHYGRLVKDIRPEIVTMENVPQMSKEPVFEEFLQLLNRLEYKANWYIVNATDYGVPQSRKRLVLLASTLGEIKLIPPTHDRNNISTVRKFIEDLPKIDSGDVYKLDSMHRAVKLSEVNLKRIKQSKPGGTWKDWDEDLVLNCHKKGSGKSYTSVYGRMEWDKPAPTITTKFYGYGNGRFGHPVQDRAISLREGALLQTFPREYKFYDEKNSINIKDLGIFIGNAVPVNLAKAIGMSIKESLARL